MLTILAALWGEVGVWEPRPDGLCLLKTFVAFGEEE